MAAKQQLLGTCTEFIQQWDHQNHQQFVSLNAGIAAAERNALH